MQIPHRARKGRRREAFLSAEGDTKELNYVTGISEVTDHTLSKEQPGQAVKLDPIRCMAESIAHDLNNILCIIRSYGDLLARHNKQDQKMLDYVNSLLDAVDRGKNLTKQLVIFGNAQRPQKVRFDVDATVAEIAKLLVPLLGENIILHIVTDSHQAAEMDTSQFDQIVVNLAINARDAMPSGGHLTILTSFEPEGLKKGCIKLMVSDTGCGMSTAIQERLFEPFFTTKEVGAGTGLGLATVYGVIHQIGGSIAVDSEVGKGSTFTLRIPSVIAPAEFRT